MDKSVAANLKSCPWEQGELAVLDKWIYAYPEMAANHLSKRIHASGALTYRTPGSIAQKIQKLRRKPVKTELPDSDPKKLDGRPLLKMLKVLWDSRKLPEEKLREMFLQAAQVVDGVYDEIDEAKLQIDKMKPAYKASIEQEEQKLQDRMDEIAAAIKENKLVDMELKR